MQSHHSIDEDFGKRLAKLRLDAGLTQRDLSREAGISHTQVSRYESGIAVPRPAVLIRLATVLATTLEFLRNGTTLEASLVELEEAVGTPLEKEHIELTAAEYAQMLELSQVTGLSLPALIRQVVLTGLRAKLVRHRQELEASTDIDGLIASYDQKIARLDSDLAKGQPKR